MQAHAKIVSALRGGDRALALAEVDRLLASAPEDSELLGLKGLALAMSGRLEEATECARLAFAHAVTPAQRIKCAGNLARLLARGEKWPQVAALADAGLPPPEGLAVGEFDAAALENLCGPLLAAEKHHFVADYLRPILDLPDVPWSLELLWLKAASAAHQHESILARTDAPSYRWHGQPEAVAFACAAATELNREAEGNRLFADYLAAVPPFAAPRQDSQILTIVQIAMTPRPERLTSALSGQHFTGNYPSQLVRHCKDRYRFMSIFVGSPPRSIVAELGPHEAAIVLNNCVNGEQLKRGELALVQAHEQALGLPVVNAAAKAVRCTRVETAELLQGIPNLIVPKVMRFRLDPQLLAGLRMRIRDLFMFPVILRSVGEQEGENIYLANSEAELTDVLSELAALGGKDFYAIQYAGVQHPNGYFRRLRAAFVDGVPTLIRADYDDQWMVRGRKFERILDHYRRDTALFEEANGLVRKPEWMGDAAWQALLEVGRRIPLDIFGMDFDVDEQGRVVFFESNATMLLLSNAPPDLAYPLDVQKSLLERMDIFFRKRAGLSLQ